MYVQGKLTGFSYEAACQPVSNGNLIVVELYCLWSARIILDSTTWSISSIAIKLFRTPRKSWSVWWKFHDESAISYLYLSIDMDRRSLQLMRIYLAIFYEGNSVLIWRLSNSDLRMLSILNTLAFEFLEG